MNRAIHILLAISSEMLHVVKLNQSSDIFVRKFHFCVRKKFWSRNEMDLTC